MVKRVSLGGMRYLCYEWYICIYKKDFDAVFALVVGVLEEYLRVSATPYGDKA
jgi:hypothetical protein